jgi:hypothetical protein
MAKWLPSPGQVSGSPTLFDWTAILPEKQPLSGRIFHIS